MIAGTVIQELQDRATGRIVARKVVRNASTVLGRRVMWAFITGAAGAGDRITGSFARLGIVYSGGSKTLPSPVQPWATGDTTPNPNVRSDTRAEVRWRWLDASTGAYTPEQLTLSRSPTEGALAIVDIDPGDRIAKPSDMNYIVTWVLHAHTGTGANDGVGNPDVVVKDGLAELFRALIESANAGLAEPFLEAALVANIAPLDPGEDPRQGSANEAAVTLSNFRTRADDPSIPSNAIQFDMALDQSTAPDAGFDAMGWELRLRWGGQDDQGAQIMIRRVFHRTPLPQTLTVTPSVEWTMNDVSFGLLNAP